MKKEYRNPDADIVKFKVRDIVITSGPTKPDMEGGGASGDADFVQDTE